MLKILKNHELILSSNSPRRKNLLEAAGIPFRQVPSKWKEAYDPKMHVEKVPKYLAFNKANAVKFRLPERQIVLAADTVVIKDDKLMGKPNSNQQAIEMLQSLSDSSHEVITGITLMSLLKTVNASETTQVRFARISEAEIDYYLEKYKPMDKAGAYGIQDWIGLCKVRYIRGSYENVIGLPVHLLYAILSRWD